MLACSFCKLSFLAADVQQEVFVYLCAYPSCMVSCFLLSIHFEQKSLLYHNLGQDVYCIFGDKYSYHTHAMASHYGYLNEFHSDKNFIKAYLGHASLYMHFKLME